ncbi:MAG: polysaccharide deacetylase family protein [Bacteroidales bacterium]|nr:polysaccharide deacetylase family protein [Bacteroidales bacterium]
MVLIYTPRVTNRIQYIVKFLIGEICGFDYAVTSSNDVFINFKGAKINYSDRNLPGDSIRMHPSGFLTEKGIREFTPRIRIHDSYPVLFPNESNQKCDLGYDLFASAFFLVSRYEEYLPFLEDRYGRFEADQSFAYQNGFLDVPLVDIQTLDLRNKLSEMFNLPAQSARKFTFIPTYDIDIAYAYKGRGLSRNIMAVAKDILTFDFNNLKNRIKVLTGKMPDPYDTYELQLWLQKKYQLNPVYFFLSARFGPRDKNISIHSRHFYHLIKKLGDYAETGIHPSFASHYKKDRLLEEIKTLASVSNSNIEKSRQHYLKINIPKTYLDLIRYNILNDYSMGFASHTGFRAGTCTPFHFFNLNEETETRLKIFPLAIMDSTLRDYMKLDTLQARKKIKTIIDTVKKFNGTFISLWHNDALSNNQAWEGWRDVYIYLIEEATKNT